MSFLSWLMGRSPTTDQGRTASAQRQAAWEKSLNAGGSPLFVQQRLQAAATGRAPWTSSMTPAELLLSRRHGIRAVAVVTGTCWYRCGSWLMNTQSAWARGQVEGWETALRRLQAEAVEAGANAVVDVKMRRTAGDEESHEYTLIGTAIRVERLPPSPEPLIVSLSMLEFVRLIEAGIVPITLAVGAASSTIIGSMNGVRQYDGDGMGYRADISDYRNTIARASLYRVGDAGLVDWNSRGLNGSLDASGSWSNQPLPELSYFWESVRRDAWRHLVRRANGLGTGVLGDTHFTKIVKVERDKVPPSYIGLCLVIGTIVDARKSSHIPRPVTMGLTMTDQPS